LIVNPLKSPYKISVFHPYQSRPRFKVARTCHAFLQGLPLTSASQSFILSLPSAFCSAKEEDGQETAVKAFAKCNTVKDGFLRSFLQSGKVRILLKRRGRNCIELSRFV